MDYFHLIENCLAESLVTQHSAILCSKHSNWLNLVCCAYIFKRLFTFISSFLKMPTFTLPPLTVSCSFCSKFCFLSLCCADVSYFTSYENRNETKLLCPSVLFCKQSVLVLYLHYKYCESLLFKYIFKLQHANAFLSAVVGWECGAILVHFIGNVVILRTNI